MTTAFQSGAFQTNGFQISAGITGALAVTEANDALVASGGVVVAGALAATEASDTLAATAKVLVGGTLAVTEANDALSAAGTVGALSPVTGTLSVTENDDVLVATAVVAIAPPIRSGGSSGTGYGGSYTPPIKIKSAAQYRMMQRLANDPVEARRRGMTTEMARAALAAHGGHMMPERLGPIRVNRHRR